MELRILLMVGAFVFLGRGVVFGQVEGDTVVARRWLNEAIELNRLGKYEEAFVRADSARMIFKLVLGTETNEVADALIQMGKSKSMLNLNEEAKNIYLKSLAILNNLQNFESLKVATTNSILGLIYQTLGEYDKAIEHHQIALDIRIKTLGEEHQEVANSYTNLGNSFDSNLEYTKAIEYQQNALKIRLKIQNINETDIADSYYNLENSFDNNGEYEKAIEFGQKALQIRIKALGMEDLDVANSFNNLGISLDNNGEFDKAIEYYQKALEIRIKLLGKEHLDISFSYNNIGVSYEHNGEYFKALEYYQKALDIRQHIFGSLHSEIAISHGNLGDTYNSMRLYKKAESEYIKALEIRHSVLGKDHYDNAFTYKGLGDMYNQLHHYEKALMYYLLALNVMQLNNKQDIADFGVICGNVAVAYTGMNEFEKAIEYSQKSQEIIKKSLGINHPYYAFSMIVYADALNKKCDFNNAVIVYEKAIELEKKYIGDNHPFLGISYNNLGEAYRFLGQQNQAIIAFSKSLDIFKIAYGSNNATTAEVYMNLGKSFQLNGDFESAIECFQHSLSSCNYTEGENFSTVNDLNTLTSCLNSFASCYQKNYISNNNKSILLKSIYLSDISIKAFEHLAISTPNNESAGQNWAIFETAIKNAVLARTDLSFLIPLNKTFVNAEKGKASLLQAQIKATDAINFSGIPNSLLEKEQNLRIEITLREKQHQTLLDQGLSETDTKTLRISSIIFDLKQDYEALKKRFETEYPEYYRLKYDLSTVSLQYVQDTLLEPKNQALLEYFVGDSSIFLFVVRPDTMVVQEVKRDFPLEDWIEGLRQGIYGYYAADKALQTDSLKANAKSKYLEFAPKLYQKLVAPVAQLLPEKVILVPDGPLGYIPFDALLTGAPEDPNNFKSYPYLIQKHQFSYTYSATLLREMRDKKHRQEPQKDFVAFAPFYNGDTTLLANMYAYDDLMRKDLQPLAFSGPEVAAASKLMHGETVAGVAATEERFTTTAGNYRIIHLATHGRADNRVGDYAFLAFTEIKDSIENELLYVKDLYNLQLNADLVVLSACETGIGKLQRGEGIISLARAFAYAGAKSIVTSLWSVNDKSTSELMRLFYRELQRGKDKDEALRLARLRFLKESSVRNGHPFFWAAFVPLGDMRPVR